MIRSSKIDKNVVLLGGDWQEGPQTITLSENKRLIYAESSSAASFIADNEDKPSYHLWKFADARVKNYSDDCQKNGAQCDIQNIRNITAEECFEIWGRDQFAYNRIPNSLLIASPDFISKMIHETGILPLTTGIYHSVELEQIYKAAGVSQPPALVALVPARGQINYGHSYIYIRYTHKCTPTFSWA